jgi:anti-anti-sigma factor
LREWRTLIQAALLDRSDGSGTAAGLLEQRRPRLGARSVDTHAVLVEILGELDIQTVPQARAFLAQATATTPWHLILDLTGVRFVASAGIALLIAAQSGQDGINGRLHLLGVRGTTRSNARSPGSACWDASTSPSTGSAAGHPAPGRGSTPSAANSPASGVGTARSAERLS